MRKLRRLTTTCSLLLSTLVTLGYGVPSWAQGSATAQAPVGLWQGFLRGHIPLACGAYFQVGGLSGRAAVARLASSSPLPSPSAEFISRWAGSAEGRALSVVAAAPAFFAALGPDWRPVGVERRLGGVAGLASPIPERAYLAAIHAGRIVTGRLIAHNFGEPQVNPVISLETPAGAVSIALSDLNLLHVHDLSWDRNLVEALRALAIDSYRQGDGYHEFRGLGPGWRTMVHRHPTGWGPNAFYSGREFDPKSLQPGAVVAMITVPARYDRSIRGPQPVRRASYARRVGVVQSIESVGSSGAWRLRLLEIDAFGRRFETVSEFESEDLYFLAQVSPTSSLSGR